MKTFAHALTLTLFALTATVAATACDSGSDADPMVEDLDLNADDFTCILDWPQVERVRVTNMLGYQPEAEAALRSDSGGEYPVGTVIQLIPTEAMVKRAPGFSPATNDWEFFVLEVSAEGTNILERGTTGVVNEAFGEASCMDCHQEAEPQFDLVCSDSHGCEPLPVSADQLEQFQQSDPRC